MPVTSIFSFFHSVFKRFFPQQSKKSPMCDKGYRKGGALVLDQDLKVLKKCNSIDIRSLSKDNS